MPEYFACPYLNGVVECTDERYSHVLKRHADFAPVYWGRVAETLLDPEQVRTSRSDDQAILFFRWYVDLGKHVIVVVNTGNSLRRWLMTAYMRRDTEGELLWEKR